MFGREPKINQNWYDVSVDIVDKRTGIKSFYCEGINAYNIDEILNTNVGGYNPNLYNFENWTIILVGPVTQLEIDKFTAECEGLAATLNKDKWPLD